MKITWRENKTNEEFLEMVDENNNNNNNITSRALKSELISATKQNQ